MLNSNENKITNGKKSYLLNFGLNKNLYMLLVAMKKYLFLSKTFFVLIDFIFFVSGSLIKKLFILRLLAVWQEK